MELDITKFLDYGVAGIAILILGVLFYIFKTFMQFIKESDERHAEVKKEFITSINHNTEMINENTKTIGNIGEYIRLKNGSFEKMIEKTNETMKNCHKKRRK
jgi:hypothetical protein